MQDAVLNHPFSISTREGQTPQTGGSKFERLTLLFRFAVYFLLTFALQLLPAHAQEMDMEVMMRWASVEVLSYHIVGMYEGRADVVGAGGLGYADVTDRIEIDLLWKLADSKLVGKPTFKNTKSTVRNLRDFEPKCLPPVLKGEYDHYEVLAIKEGLSGDLELQVQTAYPAAEVVQFCTGSRKAVPASRDTRPEPFGVISPVMFGMKLPDSDTLRISPDKKSLITKKDGWTWTFTPTIKK